MARFSFENPSRSPANKNAVRAPGETTQPEATCLRRWTADRRLHVSSLTINQNQNGTPTEPHTPVENTLSLLSRLKTQMPEIWGQAEVVGQWVWLEFNTPPLRTVRDQLKEL